MPLLGKITVREAFSMHLEEYVPNFAVYSVNQTRAERSDMSRQPNAFYWTILYWYHATINIKGSRRWQFSLPTSCVEL